MNHPTDVSGLVIEHDGPSLRHPNDREITVRSGLVAIVVTVLIGASYPYAVLQLGFGANFSVVSAFLGYLALGIGSRRFNRRENNVIQTAGTSAAQTAFLCTVLAAFDILGNRPHPEGPFHSFRAFIQCLQVSIWLTFAGLLGALISMPWRRRIMSDDRLVFVDAVATAETLKLLDSKGGSRGSPIRAFGCGALVSGIVFVVREDARVLKSAWVPAMLRFGPALSWVKLGISWSLLSLGTGMLLPLRITTSMLAGMVLAWIVAPPALFARGWIKALEWSDVLIWVLWPAIGLLVANGLAELLVSLWRSFSSSRSGMPVESGMKTRKLGTDTISLRLGRGEAAAILACTAIVVLALEWQFHVSAWPSLIVMLLTVPLLFVGIEALGKTNWLPISSMTNLVQVLAALIMRGSPSANLGVAGITASMISHSGGIMQNYKVGELNGSTTRTVTRVHLIAIPVGAATVAIAYPMLAATFGIGGGAGLQSPVSQRYERLASLLTSGAALPPSALYALFMGAALGVALAALREIGPRVRRWLPSATGLAIGVLVPAGMICAMFLGSAVSAAWRERSPITFSSQNTALASGLILGESIAAILIATLAVTKILHLVPMKQ